MPLQGAAFLIGGTVSATGGTSRTFSLNGAKIQNGIQTVDSSETDARIRPTITYRSTDGVYDKSSGKFSQDRRETVVTRPKILADGTIDFVTIRTIYTGSREVTVAEMDTLLSENAQVCVDADTQNFWKSGSLG